MKNVLDLDIVIRSVESCRTYSSMRTFFRKHHKTASEALSSTHIAGRESHILNMLERTNLDNSYT